MHAFCMVVNPKHVTFWTETLGLEVLGQAKLDVLVREVLDINPMVETRLFPSGLHEENAGEFLAGVDVLVDGIDLFAIELRRLVFARARAQNIPVITSGPIGFGAPLLIFLPDRGLSFDEYFDFREGQSPAEQSFRFAFGLAPRHRFLDYFDLPRIDFEERRGPSLGLACQLATGQVAVEVAAVAYSLVTMLKGTM